MSWARRCIKWEVPLFVVLALATTAMAAFFLIAEDVWERQAMPLDTLILNFLFGIRSPALTVLANVITAGGSVQFVAVAVVLAVVLGWRQHRIDVYALLATVIGAALLNQLLKLFFARPRPILHPALVHALGYSFPSGHSMAALSFYGILGYLAGRHLRPPLRYLIYFSTALWILLVGLSRNYLGVHYPSDVIGAYAVTLPILIAVIYAYRCATSDVLVGEHKPGTVPVPEHIPDQAR